MKIVRDDSKKKLTSILSHLSKSVGKTCRGGGYVKQIGPVFVKRDGLLKLKYQVLVGSVFLAINGLVRRGELNFVLGRHSGQPARRVQK